MSATPGRIVLLDPSLRDESGHHYFAAGALLHEAKQLNRPAALFCNRGASRVVRALPATRHFRACGYTNQPGASAERERDVIDGCNEKLRKELGSLDAAPLGPRDFVLFTSITANLVLGACEWIAGFDPGQAPRFGLCLMFQRNWHPAGLVSQVGSGYYERAFACVPADLRSRIVFTCETEVLANDYAPLLGHKPVVLPVPTIQHLAGPAARRDDRSPRIACLGYSKPEKGTHLVPDLIDGIGRRVPGAAFQVQLMGHDSTLMAQVRKGLAKRDDTTLIEGPMPAQQMVEVMQQASLMLLPYDPVTYRSRGSALFTEASVLGVPVVVPADTAIGEEARRRGFGEVFEQPSAPAIAAACCRALARLPELTDAARQEAARIRRADPGYLAVLDPLP